MLLLLLLLMFARKITFFFSFLFLLSKKYILLKRHDDVATQLAEAGAVLNEVDLEVMGTELLVAAADGDVVKVERLLNAGVDANTTQAGSTALMMVRS